MTEDYLSKVLESAYSNTICEWQAQGISDKEIIDKINQKTDGSIDMLLEQASKDYHNYFLEKSFEIAYNQKIEADKFMAHQNEIWGSCFVVSETMYVMALEAAERYSAFVAKTSRTISKRKSNILFWRYSICKAAVAKSFWKYYI